MMFGQASCQLLRIEKIDPVKFRRRTERRGPEPESVNKNHRAFR